MKFEQVSVYRLQLTEDEQKTLEGARAILQKLGGEMRRNNATFNNFKLRDIVNSDETLDQIIDEGGVWDD